MYDLIIQNSPLGQRQKLDFKGVKDDSDRIKVARASESLRKNGRIISIHGEGFWFHRRTESKFITNLKTFGLSIEAIINLPSGYLGGSGIQFFNCYRKRNLAFPVFKSMIPSN